MCESVWKQYNQASYRTQATDDKEMQAYYDNFNSHKQEGNSFCAQSEESLSRHQRCKFTCVEKPDILQLYQLIKPGVV